MSKKDSTLMFVILIVCAVIVIGIIYYYNQNNESYVNHANNTKCENIACDLYNNQNDTVSCMLDTKSSVQEVANCVETNITKLLNNTDMYVKSRGYNSVHDLIINGIAKKIGEIIKHNNVTREGLVNMVIQEFKAHEGEINQTINGLKKGNM
jgi:hypothetical protein